jgi:hypothetical protein
VTAPTGRVWSGLARRLDHVSEVKALNNVWPSAMSSIRANRILSVALTTLLGFAPISTARSQDACALFGLFGGLSQAGKADLPDAIGRLAQPLNMTASVIVWFLPTRLLQMGTRSAAW